ncbi:MAG TPA: putative quinol monooxygenase [Acidimicrobiia bacterium]|nr:putative quinol monooxygenase [Acidimicrobiia bacterium]
MILINLKIQIRADRRDEWLDRITKYAKACRDEPGNGSFEVYESIESPNEFSIIESFADQAAGAAHCETDHFKDFLVWFPTVIGSAPMIINTEVQNDFAPMGEFS